MGYASVALKLGLAFPCSHTSTVFQGNSNVTLLRIHPNNGYPHPKGDKNKQLVFVLRGRWRDSMPNICVYMTYKYVYRACVKLKYYRQQFRSGPRFDNSPLVPVNVSWEIKS